MEASEFLMGSDPQKDKDAQKVEQPQHTVYLDEYSIGKTPVTVAQFAAFVKATDHEGRDALDLKRKADHPVMNVTWDEAVVFCQWASEVTGKQIALPSEAQWEKAARGADGRLYPWGNQAPDASYCNFGNHVKGTTPVGQYSPKGDSPYGCADMAGNVWEWCADWYGADYYASSPAQNPTGPANGSARVLRGGAFCDAPSYGRCCSRHGDLPSYHCCGDGFRVAGGVPSL